MTAPNEPLTPEGRGLERFVEWAVGHPRLSAFVALVVLWTAAVWGLVAVAVPVAASGSVGAWLTATILARRRHPQPAYAGALGVGDPDVLAHGFAPPRRVDTPLPPPIDELKALVVGLTEHREPWRLQVWGTHLLIAGVTRSGKSSTVWAIIEALCPWIRHGEVEAWVLDPKGGMEMAMGEDLFTRFVYPTLDRDGAAHYETLAETLEDAVAVMAERAPRYRRVAREVTPSRRDPLIVIIVDEMATMCSYLKDSKLKGRINSALEVLCSQGAAFGVVVIGCVQDPRKAVVDFRDLFPTTIGLRLQSASQVRMVMGDGAREAGARCDEIDSREPGTAFVQIDGVPGYPKVRCHHVADATITAMVDNYRPDRRG